MKFLNEPFVEIPISIDIIIRNLWLTNHIAIPDCHTKQLHWLDGKPESAPLIKDITINLRNQPKVDPGHQYDVDHKDVLMDQVDIQIKEGRQVVWMTVNHLYFVISPRI